MYLLCYQLDYCPESLQFKVSYPVTECRHDQEEGSHAEQDLSFKNSYQQ